MNILYTLTTYPPSTGGAQIHQHRLAQELNARHNIQVVAHWDENRTDWLMGTTLRHPSVDKDYEIDGIKVHRLGSCVCEKVAMFPFALGYYPAQMLGLKIAVAPISSILAKRLGPFTGNLDLIHNVRIGREGLSWASYETAKKQNIPFVLTPVHHPRWTGRRYKTYNKLYTLADAVLALTDAEKEILIRLGVDKDRVHVIGHGPVLEPDAHPAQFLEKHGIDGPTVLFLGQHYPYKGYIQLLEATKTVWEKQPDTHFVFVGPAVEQSEAVFKANIDRRIHRLGKVSLQEKTDALAACSLLCVPSTQESFGGVYTEAWCLEKPVIGCNIPAVSEVITEGKDGFLVEQQSLQIAEKILHLLENETEAAAMGKAGKQKVEDLYNWARIAERVEIVYNHLK